MPHFAYWKKKRGVWDMKVLVHLNHGVDKSYLLAFKPNMTAGRLKAMIGSPDQDRAIQVLLARSSGHVEVLKKEKKKAESLADFTISQHGYTSERLA